MRPIQGRLVLLRDTHISVNMDCLPSVPLPSPDSVQSDGVLPPVPAKYLDFPLADTHYAIRVSTSTLTEAQHDELAMAAGQEAIPISAPPPIAPKSRIYASNVLKKRRRKMNHHKHKKWLKKMRSKLRKLS